MRVLTDKTGKGQLEVLSALAENPGLRQNEIVEETSLTKGAVSNNVKKLREKELIEGEKKLDIREDRLKSLYREHLEGFLLREKSDPDELNDLRTYLKKNVDVVSEEGIDEVLREILASANRRQDLESLNSVFKEADRVMRESEDQRLRIIGLISDKSSSVFENSKVAEEAEKILDEVQN